MDRLDRLSAYFNEKEKKRLTSAVRDTPTGLPTMSLDEIKLSCLENNGYESPELNDKLYLHFRGFKRIENLEKYTGCKAIWLDSNGFEKIENLEALQELKCLYLSKNLIQRIEGLDSLQKLHTLDLSYNRLTFISNLSCCVSLNTINLSRNCFATPASISHLQECLSISNIDFTHNNLEADEGFLEVFQNIPSLVTLSLNGNDITKLSHFRKKMISQLPRLGYLDRPIEEVERIGAEAFMSGGPEAELAARNAHRDREREKKAKEMADFRTWQVEQRRQRQLEIQEGRAQILMFTEQEQATRAAEAKAAGDAERKMLELGIDKVAARYWKLEGSSGRDVDVLEEATRQIISEHGFGQAASDETALPAPPPSTRVKIEDIDEDADDDDDEEEQGSQTAPPPVPTAEELALEAQREAEREAEAARVKAAEEVAKEAAQKAAEASKKEREEENERQRRVADSMRIYKEQVAAEKKAKELKSMGHEVPAPMPTSTVEQEWQSTGSSSFTTWQAAAEALCTDRRPADVFYWSEAMDMKLAQEVRKCVFDFDTIAQRLRDAALKGELGTDKYSSVLDPEQFTSESCRLRWAQLDAEQWCQMAPETADRDAVFKVCITPQMISALNGKQPSFQALASLSKGQFPSYLTPPMSFPSVRDTEGDDDEDEGEEDDDAESPAIVYASAVAEESKGDTSSSQIDFEELD